MLDMHSSLKVLPVINPASTSDNTARVGAIVDSANYNALEYVLHFGSLADTDATFVTLLEEGDEADLSDATAVADEDLLGTEAEASPLFSDDNKCFKLGYIGGKRYTRLTVTPAANTGAMLMSAVALLGHPRSAPTT